MTSNHVPLPPRALSRSIEKNIPGNQSQLLYSEVMRFHFELLENALTAEEPFRARCRRCASCADDPGSGSRP